MSMSRSLLLVLVLLGTALAGCAEEGAPANPTNDGGADGGAADGGANGGANGGTNGGANGGGDATPPTVWHANAYDRVITPKSGPSGRLQAYSFEQKATDAEGKVTEIKADVEVLGRSVEPIRTNFTSFGADFTSNSETRTSDVDVYRLRHTVTVVRDETGGSNVGDVSKLTLYIPAGNASSVGFGIFFVKLVAETGAGTSSWEYYVTPEMQAQAEASQGFYLPYVEGDDLTASPAFSHLLVVYGLSTVVAQLNEDGALEEGTHEMDGATFTVARADHQIGTYTFAGWTLRGQHEGEPESSIGLAAELPVPVSFEGSAGGAASDDEDGETVEDAGAAVNFSYRLTGIRLG